MVHSLCYFCLFTILPEHPLFLLVNFLSLSRLSVLSFHFVSWWTEHHVDSEQCSFAAEFLNLLHSLEFSQHLNFPTHAKGLKLVLVYSSVFSPLNLHSIDLTVMDRKDVLFNARIPSPPILTSSLSHHHRNLKSINIPSLMDMLENELMNTLTQHPMTRSQCIMCFSQIHWLILPHSDHTVCPFATLFHGLHQSYA